MTVTSASSFLCVIQEYIVYPLGIGQDKRDDELHLIQTSESARSSWRRAMAAHLLRVAFSFVQARALCVCVYT